MPRNEDGEFELVLGNKQLLSMFFVVVVLLGVFFVMGYIVGSKSGPTVSAESTHKPLTPDSQAPKSEAAVESTTPTPAPAVSAPSEPEKPAEKEEAATPAPPPAPGAPARAAVKEPKPEPASKPEPAPKQEAKAAKARVPAQSSQPVPGATYLQLSATDKADADKMVEELRKNGFSALDVENPDKAGNFRVLVGPIAAGELNKTKADLQSKSFSNDKAFVKKF